MANTGLIFLDDDNLDNVIFTSLGALGVSCDRGISYFDDIENRTYMGAITKLYNDTTTDHVTLSMICYSILYNLTEGSSPELLDKVVDVALRITEPQEARLWLLWKKVRYSDYMSDATKKKITDYMQWNGPTD